MQCEAYTAQYQADISYVRGIQHVTYTTSSEERLQFRHSGDFRWKATGNHTVPVDTQEYKDWKSQLPTWNHRANSRAILDAVGYNLDYQWLQYMERDSFERTAGTIRLSNGTEVTLGKIVTNKLDNRLLENNSKPLITLVNVLLTYQMYRLHYAGG
jgi:hypothetical protein